MDRAVDPAKAFSMLATVDLGSCPAERAPEIARGLRSVRGWLDAFEARYTTWVKGLHERGESAPAECLHTLHQGVSATEARRVTRRADVLEAAPAFAEALTEGEVGAEHADALANVTCRLDEETRAAVLAHEESLVSRAASSTPEQFARHCRSLVDQVSRDQGIERAERQRAATFVRKSIDPLSGMYRLQAELHPELGSQVFTAIDDEVARLVAEGGDRTVDRSRLGAEALGSLVTGGHHHHHPALVDLLVLIDLPTLTGGLHDHSTCELSDGTTMPVATVRRLACDARIIPVVLNGDGVPLDMGRRQRLASPEQRRALRAMYRSCAFPGCDVAFQRCEIHHVLEWDDMGPTDLGNLLPTCSRHHHLIHEGGWVLHLSTDRTLTVHRADGTFHATAGIHQRLACDDALPPEQPPRPRAAPKPQRAAPGRHDPTVMPSNIGLHREPVLRHPRPPDRLIA